MSASDNNKGSGLNYAGLIGGLGTLASTALSLEAKKIEIKAKTEATLSAMSNVVSESILQNNITNEQVRAIDRSVGDMMSKTGLDAMKAEASARAGAAMTGTAGGTTEVATREGYMVEMLDNAAIVAQGRNEISNLMKTQQMKDLSAKNRLDSLASGLISPEAASLSIMAAGVSGFTNAYSMLPASMRENFFANKQKGQ